MLNTRPQVSTALAGVPTRFSGDELAYLALTGKPEHIIRDAVVLQLRNGLIPQGYDVAREWKHCDLAILTTGVPISITEFKAMYTFNPLVPGKKKGKKAKSFDMLPKALVKDIHTRQRDFGATADVFGVLLATHPKTQVPVRYGHGLTKYRDDINLRLASSGGESGVLNGCISVTNSVFGNAGLKISKGSFSAGSCFGVPVDIHYWVVG